MNAIEKIKNISGMLTPAGIESPDKEAELLLVNGLNIDLAEIYRDNPSLDKEQLLTLDHMAKRRIRREPLQYIAGFVDFMALKIAVGDGVLIPRPETELMAEHAIRLIRTQSHARMKILDLCTGSGCLALALADAFPDADIYGTDISETAVKYSEKNGRFNKIRNASFIKGNLFEPLKNNIKFDLIISNPPYIKTGDIMALQPEIREWEPLGALDGGEDGLMFYKEIIPSAKGFLNANGILMFEIGNAMAHDVIELFEQSGYCQISLIKDYSGIERIIFARWTN